MYKRIAFYRRPAAVYTCWLLGFGFGLVFAYLISFYAPIRAGDIFMPVSFAGIIISSLLPVIILLIICRFHKNILILIFLIICGFIYGFSCLWLCIAFPGSRWVVTLYAMLSQSSCQALLLFYSVACFLSQHTRRHTQLLLCSAFAMCLIHYFLSAGVPLF